MLCPDNAAFQLTTATNASNSGLERFCKGIGIMGSAGELHHCARDHAADILELPLFSARCGVTQSCVAA